MSPFELSERWSPWSDINGIFCAASAAIDFGPLDPVVCEVVFNEEFDPFTVDTLEQAWEDMQGNPNMMSMDITLSHIDADAARVTLSYSGRRLLLSGRGSDWDRAKAAYDAAQGVLSSRQSNAARASARRTPDAGRTSPGRARDPGDHQAQGPAHEASPSIRSGHTIPSMVKPAPPRYQPADGCVRRAAITPIQRRRPAHVEGLPQGRQEGAQDAQGPLGACRSPSAAASSRPRRREPADRVHDGGEHAE